RGRQRRARRVVRRRTGSGRMHCDLPDLRDEHRLRRDVGSPRRSARRRGELAEAVPRGRRRDDDPTENPHFALPVFDSTGTQNQVYTTRDLGATWQGPTLVSESPAGPHFKPWISYGPAGQLVLVWRTWHGTPNNPSTPYDVWAAVGREKGTNGVLF